MLPATLQLLVVMIASAINDRLQRKLDYVEAERRILWEKVEALTGGKKISFTAQQRRRLGEAGKLLTPEEGLGGTVHYLVFFVAVGRPGEREWGAWQDRLPVAPRWNAEVLRPRGRLSRGDEFPDTTRCLSYPRTTCVTGACTARRAGGNAAMISTFGLNRPVASVTTTFSLFSSLRSRRSIF